MKRLLMIGSLILLASSTGAIAQEAPATDACLLHMDRNVELLSKILGMHFSKTAGLRFKNEATPLDVLQCARDGARRITIVAHAADLDSKKQKDSPLVYLRMIQGKEREALVDRYLREVRDELAKVQAELDKLPRWTSGLGADFQDSYGNPIHSSETPLRSRIRELERYQEFFSKLPADYPLYDESLMLQRIWQQLLDNPGRVEQVSIVACLPTMVERAYPELQKLRDRGVRVVFKPTNALMSFLQQKEITTPSIDWIRDSLQ